MTQTKRAACLAAALAAALGATSGACSIGTERRAMAGDKQQGTVAKSSDAVRVCQVGYLTGETKVALLAASPSGDVTVQRADTGAVVLTVKAGEPKEDRDSGDTLRAADFSALKTPGAYYLDAPGVGRSFEFRVGDDLFARPFRLAMRSFTGQRCGTDVSLAPDFPQYKYAACHREPARYDPSSGKQGTRDCTGGWHDAGDYGKYVVNSGITTATILWAYEMNAPKLRALNLDIPESGKGTPDVLAEARWNLDWMLKMQDEDGGVWHKATTAGFPGFVMPADDKAPVLVIGSGKPPYKTTASTGDFAAVCAVAARVYRPFDAAYADRCLSAAERAWAWLEKTPDNIVSTNPPGVHTGVYGNDDVSDERLWAAAELFRTTGKDAYDRYFRAHYGKWAPTLNPDAPHNWQNVQNLAMYTYALSGRANADAEAVRKIKADAVAAADAIVARSRENGYRIPLKSGDYYWGSNSVLANYAMMVRIANRFTPKAAYVDCAQDALHYLLGRNTFNTSYVTQVGTKWAMKPHHRPSAADGLEQPWPGLLMGGPNAEGKSPPARQWRDEAESFGMNENAINWNAALVFVLADALPAAPGGTP